MFYDERIHAESGKIYKKGILFAVLIAVGYAILRMISTEFTAKNYMTELFVAVCGIGILLVGLVRFWGRGDERTESEKHAYYFNAGKLMLIASLSGYALTIPFDRRSGDFPPNHFIIVLELLGYVYFFYSFKSKEISFNYTFISEDKSTYYGRVFENIGKLAVILLLPFVIAAFLDYSVNGSFLRFWSVLNGYLFSVLGLGVEYLYISFIEKLSYEDESENLLKKGTVVACIAWFLGALLLEGILCWQVFVSENIDVFRDRGYSFGEYMAALSYVRLYISYAFTALSAIVLCHMMSAAMNCRSFQRAVCSYLVLKIVSLIEARCASVFINLVSNMNDIRQINTFISISNMIAFAINAALIAVVVWGAYSLYKEKGVSKLILVLPFVPFVCNLAVRTVAEYQQEWLLGLTILSSVFSIAAYMIAFVLFKKRDETYSLH